MTEAIQKVWQHNKNERVQRALIGGVVDEAMEQSNEVLESAKWMTMKFFHILRTILWRVRVKKNMTKANLSRNATSKHSKHSKSSKIIFNGISMNSDNFRSIS